MIFSFYTGFGGAVSILGISLILVFCYLLRSKRAPDEEFKNKHVLITGGSQGLGKEVARLLLNQGASVTLVARRIELLEEAKEELSINCQKGQKIEILPADVTNPQEMIEVVKTSEKNQKRPIELLFCCAGAATPGFLIDQSPEIFSKQMSLNFGGTVNIVHPVVKRMIQMGVKGRVVLVSSTLGLMGMIGYSQYSPTKFAIRGLAESLRQELIPYGISVHVYFVATITSPGHDIENQSKPEITKLIEDGDISDPSPLARAKTLLNGVCNDEFAISSDWITYLIRCANLGITPTNNIILDNICSILARIALPIWRRYSDFLVFKNFNSNKTN